MCFLSIYEYGTLKPVKVILRKVRGKRENNEEDELSHDPLYALMEVSQQNPCTTNVC
jgi:hypothetical protein